MTNNQNTAWLDKEITEFVTTNNEAFRTQDDTMAHENVRLFKAAIKSKIEQEVAAARYMGAVDFSTWIIRHDESSFRQERAWFKVKPGLLLQYQADLMKGLDRVRTDIGLDPKATVYQLRQSTIKGDKDDHN